MGLLEKVKNFFYDEEYEDDDEEIVEEKHHIKEKKEKKEKIKPIPIKEHKREKEKVERQDISERELFKAERTFNFPMDVEDEEEEIIQEELPKIKKVEERPVRRVEVEHKPIYSGIRDYSRHEVKEPVIMPQEEEDSSKRFKPTPVISPIYGIMDKNYKKEDIMIDSTKIKSPLETKVDYDTVRKRAYSNVYKKVEEEEESKGIFYNLDEEEKKEEVTDDDDEDVKIIYNDVTYDEEEEKDDENVTIGQKIEEYEQEQDDIDDEDIPVDEEDEDDFEAEEGQILSETKEQDLFNLIDNMYNSDEDEEEEE